MRHVRTVELVGNARSVWSYLRGTNITTNRSGTELLDRTRELFAEHGFEVRQRTSSSADCDLVHMARAACLIVGGSGYGQLAAALARGTVLHPMCNRSLP